MPSAIAVVSIHRIVEHITDIALFTRVQFGQLLIITRCLIFINSCINPVVYFCTSRLYRKAFYKALVCSKYGSNNVEETNLNVMSRQAMNVLIDQFSNSPRVSQI